MGNKRAILNMMDRFSVVASAVGDWFKANARLLAVCFAMGLICHFQLYSQGLTVFDNVLGTVKDLSQI